MARKISKRQQQIYDYIRAYQQEKGYPPSVREMAAAVGLSSPSTVHAHLSALEARGLIKRDATKPRALELFNEDGSSVSLAEVKESPDRGTVTLPLVGRVAAGMPILAEQNVEDTFTLPTETRNRRLLFRARGTWRLHDQCRYLQRRLPGRTRAEERHERRDRCCHDR